MKYQIVTATGVENLQPIVNEWIQQGWEPLGGICVAPTTVRTSGGNPTGIAMFAYQAMIKR
jgi:hypothetical protein